MTDHSKLSIPGIEGKVIIIGSTESEELFRADHIAAIQLLEQGKKVTVVVWDAEPPKPDPPLALALSMRQMEMHPLIIDDVMTTGETCSQLAKALLKAGAKSVNVLTVARAYTGATGLKV